MAQFKAFSPVLRGCKLVEPKLAHPVLETVGRAVYERWFQVLSG